MIFILKTLLAEINMDIHSLSRIVPTGLSTILCKDSQCSHYLALISAQNLSKLFESVSYYQDCGGQQWSDTKNFNHVVIDDHMGNIDKR